MFTYFSATVNDTQLASIERNCHYLNQNIKAQTVCLSHRNKSGTLLLMQFIKSYIFDRQPPDSWIMLWIINNDNYRGQQVDLKYS